MSILDGCYTDMLGASMENSIMRGLRNLITFYRTDSSAWKIDYCDTNAGQGGECGEYAEDCSSSHI